MHYNLQIIYIQNSNRFNSFRTKWTDKTDGQVDVNRHATNSLKCTLKMQIFLQIALKSSNHSWIKMNILNVDINFFEKLFSYRQSYCRVPAYALIIRYDRRWIMERRKLWTIKHKNAVNKHQYTITRKHLRLQTHATQGTSLILCIATALSISSKRRQAQYP